MPLIVMAAMPVEKVDVQLVGDMVITCLDVVKVNIVELVEWTLMSSMMSSSFAS